MLDVSSQVSNSVSPNNPPIHQNANESQQSLQSAEQQQQQPKQYSVQKLALKSTKVKTLNRKVGSKASFRWPF